MGDKKYKDSDEKVMKDKRQCVIAPITLTSEQLEKCCQENCVDKTMYHIFGLDENNIAFAQWVTCKEHLEVGEELLFADKLPGKVNRIIITRL